MDDLVKIHRAKRLLLEFFPFLSSSILYIPVLKKETTTPTMFTKDGIVISDKYNDTFDIFFLLASSSLLYNLAFTKRIKGYYKVMFYLASALFSNEIMINALRELGFNIDSSYLAKKGLENFEDFKEILSPEISERDDLYRYSIDEIYRTLLYKLLKNKNLIENLIILRAKDYSAFSISSEKLKTELLSSFFKDKDIDKAIEKSSKLVNHIINAIERYVNEAVLQKSNQNMLEKLKDFSSSLKVNSAGTSKYVLENILNISKKYYASFGNIISIFSKLTSEYKNLYGKFNFTKLNIKKHIVYKKHIQRSVVVPIYEKKPIFKIYVALDSSGSISDDIYIMFVNALSYLIENIPDLEGKIYVFSGTVLAEIPFSKFSYYDVISSLSKRLGYGGTLFNSVISRLQNEKDLNYSYLIILTDGLFADSYIDTVTLSKLKGIILLTTNIVPDQLSNLKNLKIIKLKA